MRIFKTAWFNRFAKKQAIRDEALSALALDLEAGIYDADLGAGVYKKRLGRPGAGSAGGFRILICFKKGERVFFMYGFPKSARGNINQGELRDLQKLARLLLGMDWAFIEKGVRDRKFFEVGVEDGENI